MHMPTTTAPDTFLVDCESYFLDGAQVIAEFSRRNQALIRKVVERHWDALVEALGFPTDDLGLLDYWEPNKFQKLNPTDAISLGVKLRVTDCFEAAIYRYWAVEDKETGIAAYTWIKGRAKLDDLSQKIDITGAFPEPNDHWESFTSGTGTYFLSRKLDAFEIGELDIRLEELVTCYISLIEKVGGVKKFLQ
jgi:hypothetical protein